VYPQTIEELLVGAAFTYGHRHHDRVRCFWDANNSTWWILQYFQCNYFGTEETALSFCT